jgi:hypothetical protein
MDDFTKGVLTSLLPALLVSVLTSFLTVRLSLRQFYSQKWWERKAEAYSKILEQLATLDFYYGELQLELVKNNMEYSTPSAKLNKDFDEARERLIKAAGAAVYVVTPDTINAVNHLIGKLDLEFFGMTDDYDHFLDLCRGALGQCIQVVKQQAQVDLQVARRQFTWPWKSNA